jgi:hypothetical protein
MVRIIFFVLATLFRLFGHAQFRLEMSTPYVYGIFDIESTTEGILLPVHNNFFSQEENYYHCIKPKVNQALLF